MVEKTSTDQAALVESEGEEVEMTYGDYMLMSARGGDLDAVKECLTEEVPINFQDTEMSNSALHLAAANGHQPVVEYLLDAGADINLQNQSMNTPLHWACLLGRIDIVKVLCDWHNKKPDSGVKADMNLKNSYGRIPMEEALQSGQTEIAEFLAPLTKLEDDKLYSTINEGQIYKEEDKNDDVKPTDNRSIQSEECIRDDNEEAPKVVSEAE